MIEMCMRHKDGVGARPHVLESICNAIWVGFDRPIENHCAKTDSGEIRIDE